MTHYFTIGMAGHIDHGKTALTKALTDVTTDRLKEEIERSISIEPGFAPFIDEDNLHVSIIDVPGHENFIRQMIAGVAGIDMVIVAIAADEGIMPQTKEHVDILSLLGIQQGVIVMTKIDQVDDELLEVVLEDVKETLQSTFLKDAPYYYVDSLSEKGIPTLKQDLHHTLRQMAKKVSNTPFRLPIDHVFTVKGQGVIVRGTIYNGEIHQGTQAKVLPVNKVVRVRQIQRHRQQMNTASEGQRAAINIGGIDYADVVRGDVLVVDDYYDVSNRIDVSLQILPSIQHKVKQRQAMKLHIGTTEVMGRIIFFDRNEVQPDESDEVLCQIHLDHPIVATRNDRFIIRRPTPTETIGGGLIIEPNAERHRFGPETMQALTNKKDGSVQDRLIAFMEKNMIATKESLLKNVFSSEEELEETTYLIRQLEQNLYTLESILDQTKDRITDAVRHFHEQFPMRIGIDKAEVISLLQDRYPTPVLEYALKILTTNKVMMMNEQYISLSHVSPSYPDHWEKKLTDAETTLIQQGTEPSKWTELLHSYQLPPDLQKDFYYFLLHTNKAFIFDEERLISTDATHRAMQKMVDQTKGEDFTLQTARETLQLSRKNLIPLLELLDKLGYTKREGNVRHWI